MFPPIARSMCRRRRLPVVRPTYITWLTLAFMTTASVASLRSAPTMAVYGLTCVFLYIVPAIVFLLPQSLVAAELASGWTGGVFRWARLRLPAWEADAGHWSETREVPLTGRTSGAARCGGFGPSRDAGGSSGSGLEAANRSKGSSYTRFIAREAD